MRDPYSVLGVQRNANADEIKSAWRTKAKSIHPDHNQDDPSAGNRFAEVGQAYELLKDPDRRKRYDRAADMNQTINQQRESARQAAERAKMAQANAEKVMEELARANAERAQAQAQSQSQPEPQAQPKSQGQPRAQAKNNPKGQTKAQAGPAGETADDMIERIFGIGPDEREQDAAQPPQDSSATANAANNPTAEPGSYADAAPDLKPTLPLLAVDLIAGLVRRIRGTAPAPEKAPDLSVDATVTIADLLKQAWVTVHLADERDVRFPLERGATDGQVIRLKGQGLKLPHMKQGDLLVTLKAAKDANFRIEGFDIHTVLPISLEDAVLGTDVTVETPEGPRSVTIAAWSGSDRVIRIEGLGLSDEMGKRGDLVAELRILLWEKPDPKVTDLMRHMRHGLYL
jgi:DnaJ-class molecular chaperone